MTRFTTDLRENFYRLSQTFPGPSSDEILAQAMFALLTGNNIFWFSGPGRAKTQMGTSIIDMFSDTSRSFELQCTKETPMEALFGNVIPDRMRQGEEFYNLDGGIADVMFGFLDEMMDLNPYTMRTLLNVIHEHQFKSKDMGVIDTPMHSVIATSNYIRLTEATAAAIDRFMCRAHLLGVRDLGDSMRAADTYLGYAGKRIALPQLDFEELEDITTHIGLPADQGGITVSAGMKMLLVLMVKEFQQRRFAVAEEQWKADNPDADAAEMPDLTTIVPEITPRTMVKLFDFVRASAVLDGRTTVQQSDMRAIQYGMFTIGDDSGDDRRWAEVCRDYLGLNDRQANTLEDLGRIADEIGLMEAQRSETSVAQLRIGGQLYTNGQLKGVQLKGLFRGTLKHPALSRAVDEIQKDLVKLTEPHVGYDFRKGWV